MRLTSLARTTQEIPLCRPIHRSLPDEGTFGSAAGVKAGVVALCLLVLPSIVLAQDARDTADRDYVDVHLHLSGFSQLGVRQGSRPARIERSTPDFPAAARNLLQHMDRYGVRTALLMPPPRDPQRIGENETPRLLDLARQYPDRFRVAAGGYELNPMIHETRVDLVDAPARERFAREAQKLLDDGACAFGEMTALHLSFTDRHVFEQCPPDHPLFLLLAEIAARRGAAIDLHMEAVPEPMPLPSGFARISRNNPASLDANIPGLERLLAHHRGARVVWQHIGWDNTGAMTVGLLRRLLTAHPNLSLALRVEDRVRTMGGAAMPNRIVDDRGRVNDDWRTLFQDFPDRFVVGTDEFFCVPGSASPAPQSFEETWRILQQLPPDLADRIGRLNAKRIYGL